MRGTDCRYLVVWCGRSLSAGVGYRGAGLTGILIGGSGRLAGVFSGI
jgi:hypothetical protein